MNVKKVIIFILIVEGVFLLISHVNEKAQYVVPTAITIDEPPPPVESSPSSYLVEKTSTYYTRVRRDSIRLANECPKRFGVLFDETGAEKPLFVEDGFIDLSNKKLESMPDDIVYEDCISAINGELNKLTELPIELAKLPRLTFLNLAHNKINNFNNLNKTKRFHGIKHLDLSYNQIESISVGITAFQELEHLNLRGNYQLEKIPYQIVHLNLSLKELDIRNTKLARNRDEVRELKNLLPHTTIIWQ